MASKRTASTILWVLIVVFLLGVLLWSVPGKNIGNAQQGPIYQGANRKNVAFTVNGMPVTVGDFESAYMKAKADSRASSSFFTINDMRKQIFSDLVRERVTEQAMKKLGVRVNDGYLRKLANEYAQVQIYGMRKQAEKQAKDEKAKAVTPADKKKLKTADEYFSDMVGQTMQQFGGKPAKNPGEKEFTNYFVNDFLMSKDTAKGGQYDALTRVGKMRKVGEAILQDRKVFPVDPLSDEYVKKLFSKEVRGRYLFISAIYKTKASLAEAKKRAEDLYEKVNADPKQFADLARKNSDHVTKGQGGDLGWVKAEDPMVMLPVMAEYLLFSQGDGKISPVTLISGQSERGEPQIGYGFVISEKVRDSFDLKDFNWQKDREIDIIKVRQRYESAFGEAFLSAMSSNADIVCTKKEMQAYLYDMQSAFKEADDARAVALNTDNDLEDEVRATFSYLVATKVEHDPVKRIPLLETALPYAGDMSSQLLIDLAKDYIVAGQKEDALKQLGNALELAQENDRSTRQAVRDVYKQLNYTKGIKEIDDWMAKHKEAPTPPMGGGFTPNMPPPPSAH